MPTQRCPCGAKYRFPDSALGKRAKCKKCGAVFTLEPEEDEGAIPIAEPGIEDEFAAAAEQAAAAPAAAERPPPLSAAYLPSAESAGRLGPAVVEETAAPTSYARSLLATLLFPTSIRNLATFIIILGILSVGELLLPFVFGYLRLVGQVIIFGWYCAFRFGVVEEAAAGEKDLPTLSLAGGAFDDIVVPLLKWVGSWALVLMPAYVYLLVVVAVGAQSGTSPLPSPLGGVGGILQGVSAEFIPFVVLTCVGIFIWPMIILCVTLGGFTSLARPDLIVITLIKTFPLYLFTVAIVFGADYLKWLLTSRLGSGDGGGFDGYFLLGLTSVGVGVYFEIVALRVIGLYYHHFKHRFAWSWE